MSDVLSVTGQVQWMKRFVLEFASVGAKGRSSGVAIVVDAQCNGEGDISGWHEV